VRQSFPKGRLHLAVVALEVDEVEQGVEVGQVLLKRHRLALRLLRFRRQQMAQLRLEQRDSAEVELAVEALRHLRNHLPTYRSTAAW
jgi:hypothetical protein